MAILLSACGSFDNEKPLLIEFSRAFTTPTAATLNMEYSTYYGSSGHDEILASDNLGGDVIFGGFATSLFLPYLSGSNSSTVSFQPNDGFLFKMKKYSGVIAWGTFYGGRDNDKITDLVLNDGDVYVSGFTYSDNLPQNSNALLVTLQDGGTINQNDNALASDNFILKFDYLSGFLDWANYVGSTQDEDVNCTVSFDRFHHKVYLAGTTKGTDFSLLPYTISANAYNQSNYNGGTHDGYIMRISPSGILEWSTYFGSGGQDFVKDIECIKVGTNETKIYISGTTTATDYDVTNVCNAPPTSGDFPNCNLTSGTQYAPGGNGWLDAFIVEFNNDLEMEWSTMIGGTGNERVNSHSLAGYETTVVLGINSVSSSTNFPALATCTNCFNQAFSVDNPFIAKFDSRSISWSTFYGTGNSDYLGSLKVFENELYICGGTDMRTTASTANYCLTPNAGELPLCPGPSGYYFDPYYYYVPGSPSGSGDAFLASFDESNQLTWATLVKGNYLDRAWDMTVDEEFMFHTGTTWSAFITSTTQDYPQEFLAGAYNQNTSAGNVEGFVSRFTLDHTVGISDVFSSELSASVFPNPTNSSLILKANHGINNFQYSMVNLLGQTVKSKTQVFSNYAEIDCSMLSAGSYFLLVQSENLISTHKIIKQ